MLNCNLIIFSFLAFLTMWIFAFADDMGGVHMANRNSPSALCGSRVVAQIK